MQIFNLWLKWTEAILFAISPWISIGVWVTTLLHWFSITILSQFQHIRPAIVLDPAVWVSYSELLIVYWCGTGKARNLIVTRGSTLNWISQYLMCSCDFEFQTTQPTLSPFQTKWNGLTARDLNNNVRNAEIVKNVTKCWRFGRSVPRMFERIG